MRGLTTFGFHISTPAIRIALPGYKVKNAELTDAARFAECLLVEILS